MFTAREGLEHSGREKLIAPILQEVFFSLFLLQLWVRQLNLIAIVGAAIKFNCNSATAIVMFPPDFFVPALHSCHHPSPTPHTTHITLTFYV